MKMGMWMMMTRTRNKQNGEDIKKLKVDSIHLSRVKGWKTRREQEIREWEMMRALDCSKGK